ncbi:MAG: methyltetrahydrofolate cobalamin methyltransferase [Deltaproteobacteria bacterium]|nr:methyltetrahydrofolate cobalamin methyltransferase [Deltaproteobacteria bacterium]
MLIIAERINASRKTIAQAISGADIAFIQGEAKAQTDAGAHYIDVNAGTFVGQEAEKLRWIVEAVQEVTDLPLSIDSPDPAVIQAMLPLVKKAPIINSITLEPSRIEGILPLVLANKAKVIALCQAEEAMAETADDKVRLAGQLVAKLTGAGVPLDDIYIDPLVYPLSTNPQSAHATLDAISRIMREYSGVHTVCGLTNVSYGLPARKLINRAFLAAAVAMGLDAAIIDPTDKQLFAMLKAVTLVAGKDDYCMEYISAFREGRVE